MFLCSPKDEIREEKLSLRVQELEMVQNNTKLLKEMLSHYSSSTPHSDGELMKVSPHQILAGSPRSCVWPGTKLSQGPP